MLEQVDLGLKVLKAEYRQAMEPLERRLGELQRRCREAGIPIVVVFEGWEAAGKGSSINRLMRALDPRGFKVHPIGPPNEDEALRPFLWRFAIRTPHRGFIAIFDRSWYGRVLVERVNGLIPERKWREAYDEIIAFEKQLVDDNHVLVKFFLHISKKEQRRRFKKMEQNPLEAWKVTEEDWKHHRNYAKFAEAVEEMLTRTSTSKAPWTIVEAEQRRFTNLRIFETLARAMEDALARHERLRALPQQRGYPVDPRDYKTILIKSETFLRRYDLSLRLEPEEYKRQLEELQSLARQAHHRMFLERVAAIALFEGWDAAGKGGAIRRLLAQLDPRGFEVVTVAAPSKEELAHHYLWRFWKNIPKAGHLTIFDRSWYGRVLVERIEGFCTTEEWQRAYAEINEFERSLANAGIVLIKFWLHIDKEEQLRRFEARRSTPHKQWKITDEDWRNREKWEDYQLAVADMIQRTSTLYAPWTVVESNDKLYARIKVLRTLLERLDPALNAAGGRRIPAARRR
jgi:polyphosphate kinase 2 (PPK2 family)